MSNSKKQKVALLKGSTATDYLSRISLNISDKDLSSKPLVKKFIQDLKEAKADNLALQDSLEAAQNALEIKTQEYNELHETHAVLISKNRPKKGLTIIADLSLVGLGAGLGFLTNNILLGGIILLVCLLLYGVARRYSE